MQIIQQMEMLHVWRETMKTDLIGKTYTLDWDNIDKDVLYRRLHEIHQNHTNTRKLVFRQSPSKSGYHIRGYLHGNACIPRLRFELQDDARRLCHDIFNRPDYVHDVLWDRKIVQGKVLKAGDWHEYHE